MSMSDHMLIVGGGVIGLSCALELRNRGYRVSLLERGTCGGQASGAAAGMLAPFSENTEQPDDFFQLGCDSLSLYEAWLEQVKEYTNLDPQWVRSGSLYAAFHESDRSPLLNRLEWQQKCGATVEWLDAGDLRRLEPKLSREAVGALYSPQEAHLYSPAYVKALEAACRSSGVAIYEGVRELRLKEWDRGIAVEGVQSGPMYGERLVLCSGAWSAEWQNRFQVRWPVYPIRGQICSYPSDFGEVRHMVFSSQGYAVGKKNGSLVFGASEDVAGFNSSVTEPGIRRLRRWGAKLFPMLERREPAHTWAGLRPATQDGFPFLGPIEQHPRVICAFGHYRNGILLSPVTAKLVGDWVDERPTAAYSTAFSPMRFTI